MPTPQQLRTIHQGARFVGLVDEQRNDARYRLLLRNVAGVDSARDLDNEGVEDVMAVLEDLGFNGHPGGRTYWRGKVAARGHACGERAVHKIRELAPGMRYELDALVERFSDGRTSRVEDLRPGEAWRLIEMMKAVAAREQTVERDSDAARTAATA